MHQEKLLSFVLSCLAYINCLCESAYACSLCIVIHTTLVVAHVSYVSYFSQGFSYLYIQLHRSARKLIPASPVSWRLQSLPFPLCFTRFTQYFVWFTSKCGKLSTEKQILYLQICSASSSETMKCTYCGHIINEAISLTSKYSGNVFSQRFPCAAHTDAFGSLHRSSFLHLLFPTPS